MISAAPDQSSRRSCRSSEQQIEQSHKQLILLVDDELLMQELGRELLEENGYRVMVAGDGVEAVELFRRHHDEIALVILDLLMPKLDGGQTYLELKKIKPTVKAFFCTGYTPQEIIGALLEEESLRALQKPFRPAEFVQTVRDVLAAQ
jgi:two-component system cell cycle sensor histidine kinase/response regulator CckA